MTENQKEKISISIDEDVLKSLDKSVTNNRSTRSAEINRTLAMVYIEHEGNRKAIVTA
jgi:metal-responsive CopG/Arc/MetJ family transcriptional regulator